MFRFCWEYWCLDSVLVFVEIVVKTQDHLVVGHAISRMARSSMTDQWSVQHSSVAAIASVILTSPLFLPLTKMPSIRSKQIVM